MRVSDDEEAFAAFVAARAAALGRFAFLLTGNFHDAEDLLQGALYKAAKQWKRIRHDPEPYIRRILSNDNVSRWRRTRSRPPERLVSEFADDASAAHQDVATMVTVQQALARLTPRQRTVLVLRFFEDLTERQTAEIMGTSVEHGEVPDQARPHAPP